MAAALRAAAPVGTDTVPLVAPAATAVMGDRTELLPPPRGGVHAAARGGRPRWIVPVAALALVALIAIVLLAASLGHGKPRSLLPFRPARQSHNATHPPSAAATTPPATTAPPSTAPPTTGPPASAPTSVGDAAAVVTSVVDQALSAGLIDDHTAQDVEHGVQDAQHHYSDEGDTARAVESISQAKDRLAEAASKGDASAQAAAAISRALDSLANAMLASPPPSGDQGGGPQGKHDHGGGQGNGEGD
jgi:hypothetical protein